MQWYTITNFFICNILEYRVFSSTLSLRKGNPTVLTSYKTSNITRCFILKKQSTDLNRHFYKEDMRMAKKHMKRCSTSLIIRKTQITTTMRYHPTPVRMTISKKSTHNKCWRVWRKGSPPALVLGCKFVQLPCRTVLHVCVLSHVGFPATPWTADPQASLSMGFPRHKYWNGLPFPSPGDIPDPGIKSAFPVSPALAGGFFFFFFFLLKDNCFTEFCCFLSNLNMDQP